MKITEIVPQEKNKNRVSVFLDEQYGFSLTLDQLQQSNLRIGLELAESDIAQYKTESDYGKLRDATFKWLSLRPRSLGELNRYLARKSDDAEHIQKLTTFLLEQKYIDDNSFTESWIRSRTAIKPLSKRRLKQELMQKQVPLEIIDEHLSGGDYDDVAACRELIAKRKARYSDPQKLMAFLARQGFDYQTIKTALQLDSEDESA